MVTFYLNFLNICLPILSCVGIKYNIRYDWYSKLWFFLVHFCALLALLGSPMLWFSFTQFTTFNYLPMCVVASSNTD